MLENQLTMDLVWGAPDWAWPALAIAVVLSLLVLWSYLGSNATALIRIGCGLLKLVAVSLLAICLLQPMRSGTRPKPQANLLPIVLDTSQSMQIESGEADRTRHERFANLLDAESPWRVRLAQAFDIRPYRFDTRLENVDDFAGLQADGPASKLASSLQSIAERFADRPVAGLILLSDGNLTDSPSADFDWKSLGFPVYPIVPATEPDLRDVRIVDINVRQTDFESAPTTVTVGYRSVGLPGQDMTTRLTDASGRLIEEQSQPSAGDELQQVTFRFRPEELGVSFYTVSVDPEQGSEVEATDANNHRVTTIDRDAGPYRVLYVAGRPNWEFKFLRRALQAEAEVQLVGLIRIAKQEPKFSFRDKAVSGTNPLFAGLGEDEEEAAEQYDEPVILRLGVKQEQELSDGFPRTIEELFTYHGVILDDLETEFFTQDQMVMLRRFVSARGGGLLMLGGTESFSGKDFANSPLGELSPVYSRRTDSDSVSGPYRIAWTREGLLQPWTRLRETERAELDRIESMPKFGTLNLVGEAKPGAAQLATVQGEGEGDVRRPGLVVQRFGRGRTAAMLLGDLWKWSMRREARQTDFQRNPSDNDDDPAQAWRQLTRWLVNDVPRRAELELESDDNFQSVTIIVRARDEIFLPLDNAQIELEITPPSGESFTLTTEVDVREQGSYRASCWSQESGGYRVQAKIKAADGSEVGSAVAGWTAQPAATELATLQTNRTLLERIARETGGETIDDDDLERFAAELPARKVPVSESWVYPIWHRPWVLITALLCLCGEWGIRRWKGLP